MRLGIGRHFPYAKVITLALICILLVIAFIFFAIRAEPIFRERAADAASQVVRSCIDKVSSDILVGDDLFSDTEIAESGISVYNINTSELNRLRTEYSKSLSTLLADTHIAKIHITLGSLTGYSVFQGLGLNIPVRIYFGAISSVEINDEFISAGINQTKYRACLDVCVSASIVSTFFSDSRDINISLPICERILIGNVPNYYIPGKG
ncbi:MAG: sporulation protein YunB [Eubacteriales bacterium]|nr:sporulation protein YunB [Eubacteriales bacterium]